MIKFKIFTGTAQEVEAALNEFQHEKNETVIIMGVSATNEQTTIVVQYSD